MSSQAHQDAPKSVSVESESQRILSRIDGIVANLQEVDDRISKYKDYVFGPIPKKPMDNEKKGGASNCFIEKTHQGLSLCETFLTDIRETLSGIEKF